MTKQPEPEKEEKSEEKSAETKTKYDTIDMLPLKQEFDDAFSGDMKNELIRDFEAVKEMNLLSDDMLYTLLTLSPALKNNKKYFFVKVICFYKKLYAPLFKKYESLGIWAETVLGMVIHLDFKKFENYCKNLYKNVPRIEKPNTNEDDCQILTRRGKRKRLSEVDKTEHVAKKAKMHDEKKVHPFLLTDVYTSNSIVFELGKLLEWCIPTQFALIGASVYYTEVIKYGLLSSKTPYKGLKIEFAKPTVGILGARTDNEGNTFSRVEDYSNFKAVLTNMTGLRTGEECFSYGHKKNLSCVNIATGGKKKQDGFDTGYNMILIGEYSAFQSVNNMISCKGYTENVYHYDNDYNVLSPYEKKNCEELNKTKEREFIAMMNDFDPMEEEDSDDDHNINEE